MLSAAMARTESTCALRSLVPLYGTGLVSPPIERHILPEQVVAAPDQAGFVRLYFPRSAAVAQLARASACHAEGREFESLQPLRPRAPPRAGLSLLSAAVPA